MQTMLHKHFSEPLKATQPGAKGTLIISWHGINTDATKALEEGAWRYRDSLREDDGMPDDAPVPEPWQRIESTKHVGDFWYHNPVTDESSKQFPGVYLPPPWEHTESVSRPGYWYWCNLVTKESSKKFPGVSGTPGRVPALDLLRI